eukprot:UN16959
MKSLNKNLKGRQKLLLIFGCCSCCCACLQGFHDATLKYL